MTAVEWLIESHFGTIENCTPNFRNKIQQAKEMEKDQIIEAYDKGEFNCGMNETAEEYYNKTFKR